ncbi:ATP-binding protein [Chloroflexus sp.]|uniref:hybrid sensor histidine kinase/response regulator n=1 Tax=Chloroflexus sp. TaxID=1904827 RepID=UPI002ADD83EE|nr:ATP-binding protein [Chloroflexus sp.]
MAVVSDPPPPFVKNYIRDHSFQLLRDLIWISLLGTLAYAFFSPIDPSLMPQRMVVVIPLILSLLGVWWLIRRQYLRLASMLVISMLWLVLAFSAFISGGLQAPAFAGIPLVVIMAGILLGRRGALTIALFSIGTGAIFVRFADFLPAPPLSHSPLVWFITYTLYLLLAARIISQIVTHFYQSMQETHKELSERKAVEQQLRLSEEKFARLFDSAPFPMLIVRLDDNLILNANTACREFFELSSDQIIKQQINRLDWSQLSSRWPTIADTLRQEGTVSEVEFSFCRQDGSTCCAQLTAEVVELGEGLCAVVAFQDVTPLRSANERLIKLAGQQEQLATLAREALANTDLNALFTVAAEQVAQTLPISGVEFIDVDIDGNITIRNTWGQVPALPVPESFFRGLTVDHPGWSILPTPLAERASDVAQHGAVMLIGGHQRLFGALLVYTSTVLDTEAIFFLRSVANVLAVALERFHAEQERRQIESQMLQTQKLESLGLLAGGIAHDFNNLLTGIMGHTSLALIDLPPNHELQPHLAAIDQAAQRAAELCHQLLVYAGRGQRTLEVVDLSTLVHEMGNILRLPTNRSHQVAIHYDLDTNLPPILVEASQIRQVVLNLLTNAIEAIGERSGSVTLRTGVTSLSTADLRRLRLMPTIPPGDYVTLTVSDTGIGMDEATLRRIFDPFFSTKPKGHGLGLAAVQGIVRRHNGAIRVESTPGLGSTFTVYLPAAHQATPVVTTNATMPIVLRGTALIVDDDPAIRATLNRILERAGMVTTEAADGRAALSMLTESALNIDIALVDLAMPGMNGLELLAVIRRSMPQLPVLLMSGNASEVTKDNLPLDHYTDFLPKPYRSRDLLEKMSTLLQRVAALRIHSG